MPQSLCGRFPLHVRSERICCAMPVTTTLQRAGLRRPHGGDEELDTPRASSPHPRGVGEQWPYFWPLGGRRRHTSALTDRAGRFPLTRDIPRDMARLSSRLARCPSLCAMIMPQKRRAPPGALCGLPSPAPGAFRSGGAGCRAGLCGATLQTLLPTREGEHRCKSATWRRSLAG
jgi:hypothetical protein